MYGYDTLTIHNGGGNAIHSSTSYSYEYTHISIHINIHNRTHIYLNICVFICIQSLVTTKCMKTSLQWAWFTNRRMYLLKSCFFFFICMKHWLCVLMLFKIWISIEYLTSTWLILFQRQLWFLILRTSKKVKSRKYVLFLCWFL